MQWMDHYPRMVAAFAMHLEIKGGDAVSVDEKRCISTGKAGQMAGAVRAASRLILAGDHWPDKLNCDATAFLENLAGRLGGPPLLLPSDNM